MNDAKLSGDDTQEFEGRSDVLFEAAVSVFALRNKGISGKSSVWVSGNLTKTKIRIQVERYLYTDCLDGRKEIRTCKPIV